MRAVNVAVMAVIVSAIAPPVGILSANNDHGCYLHTHTDGVASRVLACDTRSACVWEKAALYFREKGSKIYTDTYSHIQAHIHVR